MINKEISINTEKFSVVLGASGSLGLSLVSHLVEKGEKVRAVTRTPASYWDNPAEIVLADISTLSGAEKACRDASVVYNCVFPPEIEHVIKVCLKNRSKLILADCLSIYDCGSGPMNETTPYLVNNRETAKRRVLLENLLISTRKSHNLNFVIARGSDMFGPGVIVSTMGSTIFRNALAGRSSTLIGDIDLPHTYTYSKDFAYAMEQLGTSDKATGGVWHVPSAPTLTTNQFLDLIYTQAGTLKKVRRLGQSTLNFMGIFNRQIRAAKREKLYQFENPFVSDHSKFSKTFTENITPHEIAIKETLDWFSSY